MPWLAFPHDQQKLTLLTRLYSVIGEKLLYEVWYAKLQAARIGFIEKILILFREAINIKWLSFI